MATLARADLEHLLQSRKLDVTLTTSFARASPELAGAPTGIPVLDTQLGGGLPRGQVSEVVGPASSGRSWIMATAVAAATQRGELVALVDTLDRFDPASASATNIVWTNLLWVRGPSLGLSATATRLALGRHPSDGDGGVLVRAVDRAVKAAAMVLSAGGFGLVVLDFSDVPSRVIRQLPMTTWLRRLVEGRDTVALLIGGEQTTRGPGGVSVGLSRAPGFTARWTGATDRARMFDGFNVRATIARARFRVGDDRAVMFAAAHASPSRTEAAEERYWPPAASRTLEVSRSLEP
jgi:hypothetical protein